MAELPTKFERGYLAAGGAEGFLRQRFFAAVGDAISAAAPTSVLECGCGAGHSTIRLRHMLPPDAALEASDVLPENLARARQVAPGIEFLQESIYNMPRDDDSSDMVVALEVLEHLDRPADALLEMLRVSSSHVLLSVPREPVFRLMNFMRGRYFRDFGNFPGHINHWSLRSFVRFVASLADVEAVRTAVPWTIVLARKRKDTPR